MQASAWLHVANLQSISPLVHATSTCQNKAGVGVLHPLLHLALELATPSQPSQEGLQVVTIKVGPASQPVYDEPIGALAVSCVLLRVERKKPGLSSQPQLGTAAKIDLATNLHDLAKVPVHAALYVRDGSLPHSCC